MKFVLIDPEGIVPGMNTGLGYLSSSLKNAGHDVKVVDLNNMRGRKRLSKAVADADVVGISIKSFTLRPALEISQLVRKYNPNAKIIAGGPHVTIDGLNFMKSNDVFDYAVVGEGESTITELADAISGKKDINDVKGVIYRNNGIVQNENRPWNNNIDQIAFPDYSVFDSAKNGIAVYPLVTSRGCPYNCSYCSVGNVIGRSWRAREPINVITELEEAKEKYKSKEFRILDDNFTLSVQRAKQFCHLLNENNVRMGWSCPNGIRADKLDNELLALMKSSGCHTISLGIESGDLDVFANIDKGEKLEDIERAVKMIKENKMRVEGFFIIGLPGSTYEKDKKSIDFAKKLRLDSASFGILVPYPGTRVWDWAKTNTISLGDWKDGFHVGASKPIFETNDYKAKDMVKLYYIANLKMLKTTNLPKAVKIYVKSLFN